MARELAGEMAGELAGELARELVPLLSPQNFHEAGGASGKLKFSTAADFVERTAECGLFLAINIPNPPLQFKPANSFFSQIDPGAERTSRSALLVVAFQHLHPLP